MKKTICLLIFFILVSCVYADKVIIFNFNYDNGKIILKEQIVTEGYYPDRNLQVEEGYSCGLVDEQNNNIYSFKFEIPNKVYTDVIENNQTVGRVIILNETDFSFIMPYIDKAKSIVCYNPRDYEILRGDVNKEILAPEERSYTWLLIYGFIALVGLIIIIYRTKKR